MPLFSKPSGLLAAALGLGAAALAAASCKVDFPDDAVYACTSDSDCGGDGYTCAVPAEGSGYCCKAADEVCDGRDNDCDGAVDDLEPAKCYSGPEGTAGVGACREGTRACTDGKPGDCLGEVLPEAAESCDTIDNDCDGQTDEGFDLQSDPKRCGSCYRSCPSGQSCEAGQCTSSGPETQCGDALDNDKNGQTDCDDDYCRGRSCRTASSFTCDLYKKCSCGGTESPPPESNCADKGDDDCNGKIDCEDAACDTKSCGAGCLCQSNKKVETDCGDVVAQGTSLLEVDNDGDGLANCEDPDCAGKECNNDKHGCLCDGTARKETDCADGFDNDRDAPVILRDCQDPDCDGQPCSGGTCQSKQCKP